MRSWARLFALRPVRGDRVRHCSFIFGWTLFLLALAIGALAQNPPTREGKLVGTVELLPAVGLVGDWRVAGVTVRVTETTGVDQDHGVVAVGALVKVEGSWLSDRSLHALSVKVLANPGAVSPPRGWKEFAVIKLQPTGSAPAGAEGVALLRVLAAEGGGLREDFKVGVARRLGRRWYEVYADEVHAGSLLTNDAGEGHLFLSTAAVPGAEPFPPGLSPLLPRQRVEVRDGSTVVLTGRLADAQWLGDGHPQREYLAVAPLQTPAGLVLGLGVTEVKESKESFTLAAFSLPPNAPVTLVVDGQSLATVVTHAQGHLHGIFTTQPTGEQLPLPEELRPVASWHRLELRSTAGELLASGEFSQIARPGTATAPGQVRRWLGRPPR